MEIMWRDEFAPHILSRGQKYYEEGRVSKIVQYGNRITAHVDGTEDYCVEIELPGGVPDSWLCTCPYAVKGNCKHMAALMFAIEEGEYTFTGDLLEYDEEDLDDHPSLPWYDAVEKLPADMLRRFLLDYADCNSEVREYLAIWYLHGLPEGLLEQWKENLQSYARARSSGRQYVLEEDVAYFIRGVRSALDDRFVLLRKVGATMDAFYWLGTAFEIAAHKVHVDEEKEIGYNDHTDKQGLSRKVLCFFNRIKVVWNIMFISKKKHIVTSPTSAFIQGLTASFFGVIQKLLVLLAISFVAIFVYHPGVEYGMLEYFMCGSFAILSFMLSRLFRLMTIEIEQMSNREQVLGVFTAVVSVIPLIEKIVELFRG